MALLLPNSIFIHVPKTGGTWVRSVLHKNTFELSEVLCPYHLTIDGHRCRHGTGCMHLGVQKIPDEIKKDKHIFGFVRHPLSWYQSYWSYRMSAGWPKRNGKFESCFAEKFTDFIEKIVSVHPGKVSCMYSRLLDSSGGSPIFIGKLENIREDLCTVLDMAGERYDADIIHTTQKINVAASADVWKDKCYYTPELLEKVLKSEREAINHFGYLDTDVQKFLAPKDRTSVSSSSYENRTLCRPISTIS